jgi:hypothetical protein
MGSWVGMANLSLDKPTGFLFRGTMCLVSPHNTLAFVLEVGIF